MPLPWEIPSRFFQYSKSGAPGQDPLDSDHAEYNTVTMDIMTTANNTAYFEYKYVDFHDNAEDSIH